MFDLTFPENNVYHIRAGRACSVCNGYLLLIKPLRPGAHFLYFKGETFLDETYTKNKWRNNVIHRQIWRGIERRSKFVLEVLYELLIENKS